MPSKDQIVIDIFSDYINEAYLLKEEDETKYSSMVRTNPTSTFNISSEKSMRVMSKVNISYIQADGSDKNVAMAAIKTWKSNIRLLAELLPMQETNNGFSSNVSSEKTVEILRRIILTSLKSKKINLRNGVNITAKDSNNDEVASYFTIENL
jgi:hypothetical protein